MKTFLFILLLSISAIAQDTKPVLDATPEVKPVPDAVKIDDVDQLRLQLVNLIAERDNLKVENAELKKQLSQQQISKLVDSLNQKYLTSAKLPTDAYEFRQDRNGNWEYGRKK